MAEISLIGLAIVLAVYGLHRWRKVKRKQKITAKHSARLDEKIANNFD